MEDNILTMDEVLKEGILLQEYKFKNESRPDIDYVLLRISNKVLSIHETLFSFMDSIRNCKNYLEIRHSYIDSKDFTELPAYSKQTKISLKSLLDENIIESIGRKSSGVLPDGPYGMISAVSDNYRRGNNYANAKVIGVHIIERYRANFNYDIMG